MMYLVAKEDVGPPCMVHSLRMVSNSLMPCTIGTMVLDRETARIWLHIWDGILEVVVDMSCCRWHGMWGRIPRCIRFIILCEILLLISRLLSLYVRCFKHVILQWLLFFGAWSILGVGICYRHIRMGRSTVTVLGRWLLEQHCHLQHI